MCRAEKACQACALVPEPFELWFSWTDGFVLAVSGETLLVRRSRPGLRLSGSWNITFALTCPSPSHLPSAISVTWGQAAFVGPIRADHLYWRYKDECLSFYSITTTKVIAYAVDPWTTQVWSMWTHLLIEDFSLDTCFVFHPGLGVWGCAESTVCICLWPFYIGTWISTVLVWGSWNQLSVDTKGQLG